MAMFDLDGLWSPSDLIKRERSLKEEYKVWESDKGRWEARFDARMDKLTEWETNTLKWEREVLEREGMLAGWDEADLGGKLAKILNFSFVTVERAEIWIIKILR